MPDGYPECPKKKHRQHPDTEVRRRGLYGKDNSYQLWECVPGGSDEPHTFTRQLRRKRTGGKDGRCPECFRPWDAGAGVPIAKGHSYTIRDMAAGLARLSEGQSYRDASAYVRARGKPAGASVSRDGRLARDWVAQYAPVLEEAHELPDEWPEVLVVDHITFRRRDYDDDGNPIPGGTDAFHVMGALSYGEGTKKEAEHPRAQPLLWLLRASTGANEAAWHNFFAQLDGQPEQVICDRDKATWAALQHRWPETEVFPCTWHLYQNLQRKAWPDLEEWLDDTVVNRKTFTTPENYKELVDRVDYLLHRPPGYFEGPDENLTQQPDALGEVDDWLDKAHEDIDRALRTEHQPLSTGALENPLRVKVKQALEDRKDLLDNLDRLNHLLRLIHLRQRGVVQEQQWGRLLMKHLKNQGGTPAVKRQAVDGCRTRLIPNSRYV